MAREGERPQGVGDPCVLAGAFGRGEPDPGRLRRLIDQARGTITQCLPPGTNAKGPTCLPIERENDLLPDADGVACGHEPDGVARRVYGLIDGFGRFLDRAADRRVGGALGANQARGLANGPRFTHEVINGGPTFLLAASLAVLSAIYSWNMGTWRVLLVDPIPDDRELQAHVLRSAGLDVIEPSDNPFREAISRRPDAVVVDVSPRRRGSREFVETLKQDPRTAAIPVVVISGYPRMDLPATEGFVGKPCSPDQIVAEVIRVVKDRPIG
jgi:CheY-like chemotaxis protein